MDGRDELPMRLRTASGDDAAAGRQAALDPLAWSSRWSNPSSLRMGAERVSRALLAQRRRGSLVPVAADTWA